MSQQPSSQPSTSGISSTYTPMSQSFSGLLNLTSTTNTATSQTTTMSQQPSSQFSTSGISSTDTPMSQPFSGLLNLTSTTNTATSQSTTMSQQPSSQPSISGISSTASQIFPNSQQSQLNNLLTSANLAVSSTTTSQPLDHSLILSSAISSSQPSSHSLTSANTAISSTISETTQNPSSHPSTSVSPAIATQTTTASQQSSTLTKISGSPVISGTPILQRPLSFPLGTTALPTSPLTVSLQSIPKTTGSGVGKFSEDKEDVSSNGTGSFSLSAPTSHSGSSADLHKTTPTPPPISSTMPIADQVTSQTVTTTSGQQTLPTTTPLNIALPNVGPATAATSTSLTIGQTNLTDLKSLLTSNQGGVGSDQAAEAIGLLNLATGGGEDDNEDEAFGGDQDMDEDNLDNDISDSKGLGSGSLFSNLSLGGGPTMSKPSLFQSSSSSTMQSLGTSGMLLQQPKVVFPGSSVTPLSGLVTQSLPPRLGTDASPNSGGMLGMTHTSPGAPKFGGGSLLAQTQQQQVPLSLTNERVFGSLGGSGSMGGGLTGLRGGLFSGGQSAGMPTFGGLAQGGSEGFDSEMGMGSGMGPMSGANFNSWR